MFETFTYQVQGQMFSFSENANILARYRAIFLERRDFFRITVHTYQKKDYCPWYGRTNSKYAHITSRKEAAHTRQQDRSNRQSVT
ncbi:hypothetical protein HMPREF9233_01646 [Actinobaculum massiliense ACS-171-V-Col2]|uniref:Uncharacterized protein n=1 Tax=Actinobaculum massiliense ACS-171-V-Col2 TaxID=883066 RepID=K9EBQ5_9ACTO|nr:hypothetical protein HMPREF9233_01646 [Actinobaculum massiliense ACS-171-V-Col2]